MKFGVREICDVVLKAKAPIKIGDKQFFKNEPVIYFDSLKTSSLEGASTTVYAQGGRGNSRLIAWEGERTVTFTMEDALISPAGFMILSGAGLITATEDKPVIQHVTEQIEIGADGKIYLSNQPYESKDSSEDFIYVMVLDGEGAVVTEPYLYQFSEYVKDKGYAIEDKTVRVNEEGENVQDYTVDGHAPKAGNIVLVDYYTARTVHAQQIEIEAGKFGGNYYLEASTLFRNTNGQDLPAEFIIPNCKIQSNFNFTMASSGDPSTFTFTMDAFPDYTRFDKTKKVLAAIQVIGADANDDNDVRTSTAQK